MKRDCNIPPPNPESDAFLVVDMQNDFVLPTGSLSIKEGSTIVEQINRVATMSSAQRGCKDGGNSPCFALHVLSQDWHPENHVSFQEQGGPWPPHCVQGTHGAEFVDALDTRPYEFVVRKGTLIDFDSYSAFKVNETRTMGLGSLLTARNVKRIWLAGVATDFCVKSTAMDALAEGFDVVVLLDLVKAVDPAEFERTERAKMEKAGVRFVMSTDYF